MTIDWNKTTGTELRRGIRGLVNNLNENLPPRVILSYRGKRLSLRAERSTLRGTGVPPVVIPAEAGIQTGPRIGVRGDD